MKAKVVIRAGEDRSARMRWCDVGLYGSLAGSRELAWEAVDAVIGWVLNSYFTMPHGFDGMSYNDGYALALVFDDAVLFFRSCCNGLNCGACNGEVVCMYRRGQRVACDYRGRLSRKLLDGVIAVAALLAGAAGFSLESLIAPVIGDLLLEDREDEAEYLYLLLRDPRNALCMYVL